MMKIRMFGAVCLVACFFISSSAIAASMYESSGFFSLRFIGYKSLKDVSTLDASIFDGNSTATISLETDLYPNTRDVVITIPDPIPPTTVNLGPGITLLSAE